MKRYCCIVLLLVFALQSKGQRNYYKPEYSTVLDTVNGRQLLKQCSRSSPKNVQILFKITDSDIQALENNFRKIFDLTDTCCLFRKNSKWKGPKVGSLDKHLYQYAGVVIDGKKYIYINAISYDPQDLADSYKNWRSKAIVICDGGEYFWGVLFDIRKKSFEQLSFNGQ